MLSHLRRIAKRVILGETPPQPSKPRAPYPGELHRYEYQKALFDFGIKPGDRVLDVGCGTDYFPLATELLDLYLGPTVHRHDAITQIPLPMVLADIHQIPFKDQSFDFVYCSHVLEHVEDPIRACGELMRIGKRGYIETPTLGKDGLFGWAKGMHKWHLVQISNRLCFFEYNERQLEGIRSHVFRDLVLGPDVNSMQPAFFENQDFFNVMFLWEGRFSVHVFYLDGRVRILEAESESQPTPSDHRGSPGN